MIVKIYDQSDASLAPLFLAGANSYEEPNNFKLNGQRVVEIAEFLRAEYIKVFYRNNRKTSISFQTARLHANIQTAEAFVMDHESTVTVMGLLEITLVSDKGAQTFRYINNAAVESVTLVSWTGITTIHEYSLVGGVVLKVKPT